MCQTLSVFNLPLFVYALLRVVESLCRDMAARFGMAGGQPDGGPRGRWVEAGIGPAGPGPAPMHCLARGGRGASTARAWRGHGAASGRWAPRLSHSVADSSSARTDMAPRLCTLLTMLVWLVVGGLAAAAGSERSGVPMGVPSLPHQDAVAPAAPAAGLAGLTGPQGKYASYQLVVFAGVSGASRGVTPSDRSSPMSIIACRYSTCERRVSPGVSRPRRICAPPRPAPRMTAG